MWRESQDRAGESEERGGGQISAGLCGKIGSSKLDYRSLSLSHLLHSLYAFSCSTTHNHNNSQAHRTHHKTHEGLFTDTLYQELLLSFTTAAKKQKYLFLLLLLFLATPTPTPMPTTPPTSTLLPPPKCGTFFILILLLLL